MPAKGKARVTDAQRQTIAKGRVVGKTHKQIAAETGLARATVEHQAVDPRTVTLIQRLKIRDEVTLNRLWGKTLKNIEKHIDNKDPDVSRRAYTVLLRLLKSGDPPLARLDPGEGGGGECTLEELLVVYRRKFISAEA